MIVIALTGGIGSGKTTVSDIFKSKNVPIIDTDVIARQIVKLGEPAYADVVKKFGAEILNSDKNINRQTLRRIIFSSEKNRLQLEAILHPLIWHDVALQISKLESTYCIVVVPLLVENITTNKPIKFNRTLVVDTTEKSQLKRSIKRDNSDELIIKNIMKNQVSRQTRLDAADDILLNTGSIEILNKEVNKLHERYLKIAQEQ